MEAVDDVTQHIHYSAPEEPLYPSDNYNGVNHANTHLTPFSPHSTAQTPLKPQSCFFIQGLRWRRLCISDLSPENESESVIQYKSNVDSRSDHLILEQSDDILILLFDCRFWDLSII